MTQVRAGLVWIFVMLTCAGSAQAQAVQEGWEVSVDFLILATRGNDVHVGDVFTETQRDSTTRFDYGVTYEPIVTRMKRTQNALVAVRYRGAQWGFGARGWRVRTDGAVEGEESTPPPTTTFQAITGIRMWDHSLIPVTDERLPSDVSDVTFDAENSLKNFRIEGFAERRLVTGTDNNVSARFGLAHARVENTRAEGQTQSTFIDDDEDGTFTTLTNDIAITSESDATANLTGPVLALAGDSTFRRVRVDWLISQAALLGTAETSGRWRDVDDITFVQVTAGTTTVTDRVLDGSIPLTFEERVVVPTLDFQVKASVQATRAVSVGVGYFSSTWFRMPVAPAFSVPGQWIDIEGTGWRHQKRDVTFSAFSVFAAFGF